jgi:hypothetical protein
VRDNGGAAPSILDVEAQPAAAQVLPRRRPPPAATKRRRAWIWARRRPSSSTATTTVGVSVGPGSGPDGPKSGLGCFFYFQKFIFVSVNTINRSFFVSYKSYRLLEPIRNIGFQPIPQIFL